MTGVRRQSNFSQLKSHDEQLERLGLLAERYFADDPNTCLLKLRQLAESMAQSVASRVGLYASSEQNAAYPSAQPADSNSACASTIFTASSCKSGG